MERRYYKLSEVAKMFGTSSETIRRWCITGELESVNKGGNHYVPVEAIEPHQNGFKSRRVLALEKENSRLKSENEALRSCMRNVAGTLLQKGEI